jgi:hypothetical protein
MFGLALFGSILEKIIGSKRFLWIYLGIGVLGNLIGVFLYPRSLGASGAIFGILGLLAVLRPNMQVWVMYFPMPMWAAAIVWFLIDFVGIFAPAGTANAIHIILSQEKGDNYNICGYESRLVYDLVVELYENAGINLVKKDNILYDGEKELVIVQEKQLGFDSLPTNIRGTPSKLKILGFINNHL